MPSNRKGSIKLFRFAGIDVFLHWSWFFVAAFEISARGRRYPSIAWNVAEYLALFLIVTFHEFLHDALPSSGRHREQDYALALGWGRLCRPAATPSSDTLEHCRWPT